MNIDVGRISRVGPFREFGNSDLYRPGHARGIKLVAGKTSFQAIVEAWLDHRTENK